MTVKRDLKKRVRARQARTGERYTTALEQVLAQRGEAGVPVVELVDLTPLAAELGLHGRVVMFPDLAERIDAREALERIKEVLLATEEDDAPRLFRSVLLRGEPLPPLTDHPLHPRDAAVHIAMLHGASRALAAAVTPSESMRFLVRARAGVGGASENGMMLAVPVAGKKGLENVVCLLWGILPFPLPHPWPPTVVLRSPDWGI
jgi:hypothetical protein